MCTARWCPAERLSEKKSAPSLPLPNSMLGLRTDYPKRHAGDALALVVPDAPSRESLLRFTQGATLSKHRHAQVKSGI